MASVLIKCKSITRGCWLVVGGGSAVAGLTNKEERRGEETDRVGHKIGHEQEHLSMAMAAPSAPSASAPGYGDDAIDT